MLYSKAKDIQLFVQKLVKAGCTFQRGKKHGKLYIAGTTRFLTIPVSPSCWRAHLNLQRDLRNLGAGHLI